MATYENYVGGWRPSVSSQTFVRESPSDTRVIVGEFAESTSADVDRAGAVVAAALPQWANQSMMARARVLASTADLLRERAASIGQDLTREEGKPLREAVGEVLRAADVFDHMSGAAGQPQGNLFASSLPAVTLSTVRRPIGVVAAITPFNFPAFVASFKVAAALMAGNGLIWKPSPLTPLTGIRIVEALLDSGLPSDVIAYLTGTSASIGEHLVSHPSVAAVSFTGSTGVGRAVENNAARNGKRVQVEKGGHNALIVLSDADIEIAADAAVEGAFGGTGQKCTSTARLIVEERVATELTELIVERARRRAVGDPFDEATDVGPLVSSQARDRVADAVAKAQAEGAVIRLGGDRPSGAGFDHGHYLRPTVLDHVTPEMTIAREEVFGPTLALIRVPDREAALEIANATEFGLSAGIYTDSAYWINRFVTTVRAGMLNVNLPTTGVEPQAPFGGVKESGSGPRELGPGALEFYQEEATVILNSALPPRGMKS